LGNSRSLARRIAYEREQREWKQSTLARRMTDAGYPTTQSTISKLEQTENPRRITVDELVGFSQVFGIRADDLLLPPEVVADRDLRRLLDNWRKSRLAEAEARDGIAAYLEGHPDREGVLQDLFSDGDWSALTNAALAAVSKLQRSGALAGMSFADMKKAHEQEARRGKHRS
jgi:transcriptional regulator with XRE-family HTH domain